MPGFTAVPTVCGPLGRSVADMELACRVVFGRPSADYDPAPLAYRDVKLPTKLRFGYYKSGQRHRLIFVIIPPLQNFMADNFVKASPVCQRAVMETVEALRREGHECVEFSVPHRKQIYISRHAIFTRYHSGKTYGIVHAVSLLRREQDTLCSYRQRSEGDYTALCLQGCMLILVWQQFELATVSLGPMMFGTYVKSPTAFTNLDVSDSIRMATVSGFLAHKQRPRGSYVR